MEKIGIVGQVPIEILIAAGYWPVDLVNVFLADDDPGRFVQKAERDGFPLRSCARAKGAYGACLELGVKSVVVVDRECSSNMTLFRLLDKQGVRVSRFKYPEHANQRAVQRRLQDLAEQLETELGRASSVREELAEARDLARKVDEFTWSDGLISGWENHHSLLTASDFGGSHIRYCDETRQLILMASQRRPFSADALRLAYVGAPCLFAWDLYHFLEAEGAHVVFNETQRQRTMPNQGASLVEQYANLTHPYQFSHRLRDIGAELRTRHVDGVIHHAQAFCQKEIAEMLMRRGAGVPVITLDGNDDYVLTKRTRVRLNNFLQVVRNLRDSGRKISDYIQSERRIER